MMIIPDDFRELNVSPGESYCYYTMPKRLTICVFQPATGLKHCRETAQAVTAYESTINGAYVSVGTMATHIAWK
jgi:hypothetical protein